MEKIAKILRLNLPRYRLSKLFFYTLLVFLPIQTRKIFFTSQSYYYGYHAFYNTVYLYLTDLLFLGIIIAWIWENFKFSRENHNNQGLFHRIYTAISTDKIYRFCFVFWLILATSLIFSRETFLGFYGLAKITECFLLFAYVRENIHFKSPDGKFSREITLIFWLILATFAFQSLLGTGQYFTQSSFGLKMIGEEFLRPGLSGIAEFETSGIANSVVLNFFPYLSPISDKTLNIRAYGTLSHPNVLAGLLFAGLIITLFLLYSPRFSREKSLVFSPITLSSQTSQNQRFHVKTLVLSIFLILIITGLVLSFSRLAWAVSAAGVFAWFGMIFWKLRSFQVRAMKIGQIKPLEYQYFPSRLALIVFLLVFSLGFNFFLFGRQIQDRLFGQDHSFREYARQESLADRKLYEQIALDMINQNPIFGVGWKNFVSTMDDYTPVRLLPFMHQPVHNIYLLIGAEGGILALFVFVLILYNIVRHAFQCLTDAVLRYTLLVVFFGFLVLGLFDHYFFTIQQGALMFWTISGLLAIKRAA